MSDRNKRWTDNPFRPANLTPEEIEWRDKRDEAIRRFHETGDKTMAQEIGLFPKDSEEPDEEEGICGLAISPSPLAEDNQEDE